MKQLHLGQLMQPLGAPGAVGHRGCHHRGGSGDVPIAARGAPSWPPERASRGCRECGDLGFFGKITHWQRQPWGSRRLLGPGTPWHAVTQHRVLRPVGGALLCIPELCEGVSLRVPPQGPRTATGQPWHMGCRALAIGHPVPWGSGCRGAPSLPRHPQDPHNTPGGAEPPLPAPHPPSYFNSHHLKYCNYGNCCR